MNEENEIREMIRSGIQKAPEGLSDKVMMEIGSLKDSTASKRTYILPLISASVVLLSFFIRLPELHFNALHFKPIPGILPGITAAFCAFLYLRLRTLEQLLNKTE